MDNTSPEKKQIEKAGKTKAKTEAAQTENVQKGNEQTKAVQKTATQTEASKKENAIKEAKTSRKLWKRILKIAGIVLGVLVLLVAAVFGWLTITEFRPKEREKVPVTGDTSAVKYAEGVKSGDSLTLMTWNLGYGALGDNADFFMDGGKGVKTASRKRVQDNLTGIISAVRFIDPDVAFFQEVDRNSHRSSNINEEKTILDELSSHRDTPYNSSFAYNFKVKFVPYPIPPIGKVNSGIMTMTDLGVTGAERIKLPCPFSWPVRLGNLKRCLMVSRVPVRDENGNPTGRELVLINLHLEAYDSGEGKIEQTRVFRSVLQEELDKGNYVIAGGDFNQTFSNVDTSMYPEYEGKWKCGRIDISEFSSELQFVMDNHAPTCRSLDRKYEGADKETFQYYMLDGFIVSSNVQVDEVSTLGLDFQYTDHNPVVMRITLK